MPLFGKKKPTDTIKNRCQFRKSYNDPEGKTKFGELKKDDKVSILEGPKNDMYKVKKVNGTGKPGWVYSRNLVERSSSGSGSGHGASGHERGRGHGASGHGRGRGHGHGRGHDASGQVKTIPGENDNDPENTQRDKYIYFYDSRYKYYEFTNFYKKSFKLWRYSWPTSEHAFQAAKYMYAATEPERTLEHIHKILEKKTPRDVFDYVREKKRDGSDKNPFNGRVWARNKYNKMIEILMAKFGQNDDLQKLLLGTGNKILVENAGSKDCYWGNGCADSNWNTNFCGRAPHFPGDSESNRRPPTPPWNENDPRHKDTCNKLGQALMEVRERLRGHRNPIRQVPDPTPTPTPTPFLPPASAPLSYVPQGEAAPRPSQAPAPAQAPNIQQGYNVQYPPQATPEYQLLTLMCPEGAGPGTHVQAQSPGGTLFRVVVPAGVGPGQTFQVQVPTNPSPQPLHQQQIPREQTLTPVERKRVEAYDILSNLMGKQLVGTSARGKPNFGLMDKTGKSELVNSGTHLTIKDPIDSVDITGPHGTNKAIHVNIPGKGDGYVYVNNIPAIRDIPEINTTLNNLQGWKMRGGKTKRPKSKRPKSKRRKSKRPKSKNPKSFYKTTKRKSKNN